MRSLNELSEALKRLKAGASDSFSHGREDYREALKRAYGQEGRDTDGAKINQMLGSNRTVTMLRELIGVQPTTNPSAFDKFFKAKPEHVKARQEMGLGLSEDRATRIGQILGTIGSDIVQDRGRELWWLLNAPQAAVNVVQDVALHRYAPEMDETELQMSGGRPITSTRAAQRADLVDAQGRPKAGVNIAYEQVGEMRNGKPVPSRVFRKRKNPAGNVDALAIPAGLAINSGIGLMNPFGGQEGYKAAVPSEEDPNKTDNVVAEVASKYILGRTGNLLPWNEFKKVRPDVSKDEYMRYKAFKFDNDADLNPFDDGEVVLPTGVMKFTDTGIHGAEMQFLGRSLPFNTALMPAAAAITGTTLGARGPRGSSTRGLMYGLGSTLTAMGVGNLLEQERRRRNAEANQIDTIN